MAKRIRTENLIRYSWKGPGHGRASFTVYKDIKEPGGRRITETIKDDRLVAINRAFKAGAQGYEVCKAQVKEMIGDLYLQDRRRRGIRARNEENYRALDEYWNKVYSFRGLISEQGARLELKRAIGCLDALSIYSASREDIQLKVDQAFTGNTQRRMVARLTQILRFIGRENIKLRKQPEEFKRVTYLNEDEINSILMLIENKAEKALITLCYYSGVRIGEAYALEPHSLISQNRLRVNAQIDRFGKRRLTKNRKSRIAYLCPQGVDAFHDWVTASSEERDSVDRDGASRDVMKRYCKMAFPKDPSKHITFHALRHCYAINLLNKGVSMSLVAQSLGNTLSVCQQYYIGFELTNESIEAIDAILRSQKKV